MKYCCICKKKYGPKENLHFFEFPWKHPERLDKWFTNLAIEGTDLKPTRYSVLCSRHFKPSDLSVRDKAVRLHSHAVPQRLANTPCSASRNIAVETSSVETSILVSMYQTSTPNTTNVERTAKFELAPQSLPVIVFPNPVSIPLNGTLPSVPNSCIGNHAPQTSGEIVFVVVGPNPLPHTETPCQEACSRESQQVKIVLKPAIPDAVLERRATQHVEDVRNLELNKSVESESRQDPVNSTVACASNSPPPSSNKNVELGETLASNSPKAKPVKKRKRLSVTRCVPDDSDNPVFARKKMLKLQEGYQRVWRKLRTAQQSVRRLKQENLELKKLLQESLDLK